MNQFTIKDIENLTGIKSHTLRIWEQRYGIPHPKRTTTNIRFYDDEDLKLLLNVSMLNRQGHKISRLTSMSREELEEMAYKLAISNPDSSIHLESLLAAMFNLDESAFDRILNSSLIKFGLEHTMIELFFPFLKRIGMLWQTGQVSPAYEHFISNLIRQKIIIGIDSIASVEVANTKKFLLFLPEGETHELGLLFANYIIRSKGHHTVYLGQDLPYSDIESIVNHKQIDYIISALTLVPVKNTPQTFINNIAKRFKDQTILLTGTQVTENKALTFPKNVIKVHSFSELSSFVDQISNQPAISK